MCIDVDMQYSQGCKCANLFKETVRTMKIWSSLRKETASPPNNSARTCRGTASNLHMAPRYANQDFTSTRRKLKIWILSIKAVALSPVFAKKQSSQEGLVSTDRTPHPAFQCSWCWLRVVPFAKKTVIQTGGGGCPYSTLNLGGGGESAIEPWTPRGWLFFSQTPVLSNSLLGWSAVHRPDRYIYTYIYTHRMIIHIHRHM